MKQVPVPGGVINTCSPDDLGCPVRSELSRTSAIAHNLVIVLVAAFLCLPCLIHGIPPTGDSRTAAIYQHQFSRQFWNGDFYPRWLAHTNKGYGSPIFLIQYPLPYWITALVRPIAGFSPDSTREARELGVLCFLVFAAAGLAARFWFQKRRAALPATVAAIVYISLPYLLAFDLYTGAAVGRLATLIWMPLALAACESLRLRFGAVSALGIVWALLIVSNLLTALLFLPLMIGYAFACREFTQESFGKRTASVFLSLGIGSCLAAAYLLPFFVYRRLFDIKALMHSLPGLALARHLSFVRLASLGRPVVVAALVGALIVAIVAARASWRTGSGTFARVCMLLTLGFGISMIIPGLGLKLVALSGLTKPIFDVVDYFPEKLLVIDLLTLALGVYAYCQVSNDNARRDRTLSVLLFGGCFAFMIMQPWSAFFWKAVPAAGIAIQFPHRFGEVLSIAAAGLFAAAFDIRLCGKKTGRLGSALPATAVAIAVIVGGILAWRADWRWRQVLSNPPMVLFDETRNVDPMYRTYVSSDHVAAFSKFVGAELNNYDVESTPIDRGAVRLVQGQGFVKLTPQNPRKFIVSYAVLGDARARISQLYSPLWKVESARPAGSLRVESSAEGLIEISLPQGAHNLELVYDVGWPERYGIIVTLASAVMLAGGLLAEVVLSRASLLGPTPADEGSVEPAV